MHTLAAMHSVVQDQLTYQLFSDEGSRVCHISDNLVPHLSFSLESGKNRLDDLLHLDSHASALLRHATTTRQPVHFRASIRKEGGILLPVYWTIIPQSFQEGYQWYGFPPQEKYESENRLHEIERTLSSLHDIVFEIDENGVFANFWVDDINKLFLPPAGFLGKELEAILASFPSPVGEKLLHAYSTAKTSQRKFAVEYPSWNDASWFMCRFMPVRHADSSYAGMIIVVTDITQQKNLENDLRESEQRHRDLFENAHDIIYTIDFDGRVQSFNRQAANLLEYAEEEIIGQLCLQFISPERLEQALEQGNLKRQGLSTDTFYESEFISRSGKRIPVEISSRVIFRNGLPDGIHVTAKDIRLQKQAALQLAKSEAKFRFLAEHSRDLICLHRPNGDYIYISPSVQSMLGYEREELIGKSPYDYFHPDDAAAVVRIAHDKNFMGIEAPSIQYRYRKKNGEYVWLESVSKPIMDDGELIYIQTNSRDITERKHSEEKLRQSEERFKALFQNSLDVVLIISENGILENATPSFEKQLGYKVADCIGKPIRELVHPEQVAVFDNAIQTVLHRQESDLVLRIQFRHQEQHWSWMELKATSAIASPTIHGLILSLRNITEYIEIEKTLQHYSDRITGMLHSITDGFIAVDRNFTITMFNAVAQEALLHNNNLVVGSNLWGLFPEAMESISYKSLQLAMSEFSTIRYEQHIDSLQRWFDVSAFPYDEGLFIYFKDVTNRIKQEKLLQLEKQVLEMHTGSNASLDVLADHLLRGVEQISHRFYCAVCMVKNNLRDAEVLAAPNLPQLFWDFTNATPLEPELTTCGRAIIQRKPVAVPDVENSDFAESTKNGARALGIKATLSLPMINTSNEVLGTFSIYFLDARLPSELEMEMLSRLTHLLTMIIENKQAAEKLWISNERYLLATKASNEAIWDWDAVEQVSFWGEGFNTLFGYPSMFYTGASLNWENKIHPDDRDRVLKLINKYLTGEKKGLYKTEYRFCKADGTYALVVDKGYCLYDDKGTVIRMIGSTEDITERKHLEEKLLQQEIHKQQQIEQAVVDVQENERAEIGKELHDNVNQLLTTAKLFLELARNDVSMQESMLKRSSDTIMNAINEIRKISRSLMPASLNDLGLISSITDLIENINLARQLHAEFKYDKNIEKRLKAKEKLMFFRIIQEQANNVLKHADASHLLISITNHRKLTRLEIKDNGKGFDLELARKNEGIGMLNIMSRAAIFNAGVEIITAPGKGCHLVIDLPYSSKKTIPE
jgi:PAS domain S-box-containing protein